MKYKVVYRFRWVLLVAFLFLIYISNFFQVKLYFLNVQPQICFKVQDYNIQVLITWLTGIILGPRLGALTLGIYLLTGLLGFPVFAGGGGIDYFKEPTFGYLISLPLNAFFSGWFYEKNQKLLALFIPIMTTHLFGIIYLLLFNLSWLEIGWYMSFSMIAYDLIFAFLLIPVLPFFVFLLRELCIEETSLIVESPQLKQRTMRKNTGNFYAKPFKK